MLIIVLFRVLIHAAVLLATAATDGDGIVEKQHALSQADLRSLYERFWQAFTFPNNIDQLMSINSTLFAEEVIGRVDVSRMYVGRELNTEYIFGSFSDSGYNPDLTTVLGAPLSHRTMRFATNGNIISASELVVFNTSLNGRTVPIQVDGWLLFNDQGEIVKYDTTFRWSAWVLDEFVTLLQQNWPDHGTDELVVQMVSGVCRIALEHCTGSLQQYKSYEECTNFLVHHVRFGASYEFGRNTLLCRNLHAKILPLRPAVHCAHIGPGGGDMCTDDTDYRATVLEPLLASGQ